jgi:hypothetical protein
MPGPMIIALKLLITPVLIAMVSLAGRRWGPAVSGLLIGLPLTSGPISFILARQYGTAFAVQAATGTILGQASMCLFALAFSRAAQRMKWPFCAVLSLIVFFSATVVWTRVPPRLLLAFGILMGLIATVLLLLPRIPAAAGVARLPKWDLPARMVVATLFVLALTTAAGALGPQLSGLLSPIPVFGLVLAAFTQHQSGPGAVTRLLRGVVLGSWAFGAFFLVVGGRLPTLGIGPTYALATLVALCASAISFYVSRLRGPRRLRVRPLR